jgi:hypothetical protein
MVMVDDDDIGRIVRSAKLFWAQLHDEVLLVTWQGLE